MRVLARLVDVCALKLPVVTETVMQQVLVGFWTRRVGKGQSWCRKGCAVMMRTQPKKVKCIHLGQKVCLKKKYFSAEGQTGPGAKKQWMDGLGDVWR